MGDTRAAADEDDVTGIVATEVGTDVDDAEEEEEEGGGSD